MIPSLKQIRESSAASLASSPPATSSRLPLSSWNVCVSSSSQLPKLSFARMSHTSFIACVTLAHTALEERVEREREVEELRKAEEAALAQEKETRITEQIQASQASLVLAQHSIDSLSSTCAERAGEGQDPPGGRGHGVAGDSRGEGPSAGAGAEAQG